ncbi:MAG TPA: winged helix DNA-binding domain-containing protein, partial [Candidatus Acidoferrum sp.]|nr:winged helix DNA-binding domain-containing protein [Candidatus Acidoferrum sp.]
MDSRARDAVQVAGDLVGLHGTDPASVFLAAAARIDGADVSGMERAMYDDRTLVRILGMRRTMFVVPVDLAGVIQASCTREIAARERRNTLDLFERAGLADDPRTYLEDLEASALRILTIRGGAVAVELGADDPRLRQEVVVPGANTYGGHQYVVSRVLFLLAADGRVVRGRPRGSWISSQYRWSTAESWLGGRLPERTVDEARVDLVRRWLAAFGPGTEADIKWWTGWTLGQVRRALAEIGPAEVDLYGTAGLALPDDLEPTIPPEPWIALLPALDPTVMGWAAREWYLGEHRTALFDRNGNAGPTIWCDGRVVGGWASTSTGVVTRLFEDIGTESAAAVDAEA